MVGTTLSYDVAGSLLLYVGSSIPPSIPEWTTWVDILRQQAETPDGARLVVVAGDGAPGPAQRKQLIDAVKGGKLRTAVVSDSMIARGIVTAFRWYGLDLDSFKPAAIEVAYRFVSATPTEAAWLRETLAAFQRSPRRAASG